MTRTRAYGLEIEAGFALPGLPPVAAGPGPVTTVELAAPEALAARWGTGPATRVTEERLGGEAVARWIDHRPGVGYRFHADGFGQAIVSEAGDAVWCAPPDLEPWSWQRFLVGRVLPWAAVLAGQELFHAAAVTVGDAVVAFTGPTGAGKTSLAARTVLGGGRLVTDDVLALEPRNGAVLAHPGASLLCLRPAEVAALGLGATERLGDVLGVSGKTFVAVEREPAPLPLAALFFLASGDGEPRLEPLTPDPRLLLGSTFNESLVGPDRLRRHLGVCADIAERVPAWRLCVGREGATAAAARLALDHVRERSAT